MNASYQNETTVSISWVMFNLSVVAWEKFLVYLHSWQQENSWNKQEENQIHDVSFLQHFVMLL